MGVPEEVKGALDALELKAEEVCVEVRLQEGDLSVRHQVTSTTCELSERSIMVPVASEHAAYCEECDWEGVRLSSPGAGTGFATHVEELKESFALLERALTGAPRSLDELERALKFRSDQGVHSLVDVRFGERRANREQIATRLLGELSTWLHAEIVEGDLKKVLEAAKPWERSGRELAGELLQAALEPVVAELKRPKWHLLDARNYYRGHESAALMAFVDVVKSLGVAQVSDAVVRWVDGSTGRLDDSPVVAVKDLTGTEEPLSEHDLEALRALYDPYGSGEYCTLEGSFEVMNAL